MQKAVGSMIALSISLLAMAIYVSFPSTPPVKPRPNSYEEFLSIGRPNNVHFEFIEQVRIDLGVSEKIIPIFGKYRYKIDQHGIMSPGRILSGKNFTSYILIDEEFFYQLLEEEQKAFIAHELGHLIYKNNDLPDQINADLFAVKYTSRKAVLSWLNKLYEGIEDHNYYSRIEAVANLRSPFQSLPTIEN